MPDAILFVAAVFDATLGADVKRAHREHQLICHSSLPISGPYFAGAAIVPGTSGQLVGRLDCAAASRLVGTLATTDGRTLRIVGLLSITPPNPHWQGD